MTRSVAEVSAAEVSAAGSAAAVSVRLRVADDATLKNLARATGGRFYKAKDAGQLEQVFAELPRHVVRQRQQVEISAAFAAFGALLTGAAMLLSLLWNRVP